MPIRVTVNRLDGGPRLVIEGAESLALEYFGLRRYATYDERAAETNPLRIDHEDVRSINATLGGRSRHSAWEALVALPEPVAWLAALDLAWDLLARDDSAWDASGCAATIEAALNAAVGRYRGVSVASKVLHLKRPALFPLLDGLVLDQLGATDGTKPMTLNLWIRAQERANLSALAAIQRTLATRDVPIERSLVRILDALLWSSHPAAGLAPILGRWEHRMRLGDEF